MKLYRQRLIPEELVLLDQDEIVQENGEHLITRWKVLKPRSDFTHGCSCYFLKEGFKVSKMLCADGSLKYWYCDIIKCERMQGEEGYVFRDLLADVIVENGIVRVIDLDELAEAYEENLITKEEMTQALRQLNALLTKIYEGDFGEYQKMLEGI